MSLSDAPERVFTQPTRQIVAMFFVLGAVAAGGLLMIGQISQLFLANIYLNGFISLVFLTGILATFWQVGQVITSVRWLRNLQAGFKGHDIAGPPALIASMAPMIREGRIKRRLATSATRSILDSIAVRLEESREITRYITNLLIFLGLLGTFWGLSLTVPAVVDTIRSLAPDQAGNTSDVSVFDRLMVGLEDQLGGMGTAFASSLVGLAGSLIVGLLELFAGHGQNRFYRELEDFLTSFTRLGFVSEGEGPEGALITLLERVDEGLERTSSFAESAEQARIEAERRLGAAADVVAQMVHQIERERATVAELVTEMREARERESGHQREAATLLREIGGHVVETGQVFTGMQRAISDMARSIDSDAARLGALVTELGETRDMQAGRDHAILAVLRHIDEAQDEFAAAQHAIRELLEQAETARAAMDDETATHLRSIDRHLRAVTEDLGIGRQEAVTALRGEIRALTNLIDLRTRED